MTQYYIKGGNLYEKSGKQIPEENGLLILEIDGQKRKFVKSKYIFYLQNSGGIIEAPVAPAPRLPKPKIVREQKPKKPKTWTRRNPNPKKRTDFTRRGIGLVVVKGEEKLGPYISLADCSRNIGVSKSSISKILNGKQNNKTGYIFTYERREAI